VDRRTPAEERVITEVPVLDEVLSSYATELGRDFVGYRNHVYRQFNLCVAFVGRDDPPHEKIAIASAFHDIGIWTARTFDYLAPSVALAREYLTGSGRQAWMDEVTEMILQHHKLTAYRARPEWIVEPFRRADWVDVSGGLITFGLRRSQVETLQAQWPSAGFHRRLVALGLSRVRSYPWSPLPMVRL
jgi:hypothetical protein